MANTAVLSESPTKVGISEWATNWTAMHATAYMSSGRDLFLAGPRIFSKLGSLLQVPDAVQNVLEARFRARTILAEPTSTAVMGAGGAVASEAGKQFTVMAAKSSMQRARSFSDLISYSTSKWALGSLLVSLITNRILVFASLRRNLRLSWKVRLAVRFLPIVLLFLKVQELLQSMQCQTSSEFTKYTNFSNSQDSDLISDRDKAFFHGLSKTLLFGTMDVESCQAMQPFSAPLELTLSDSTLVEHPTHPMVESKGSLALLWPLFKILSFSQIIETLVCAVEGRQLVAETGMSLFEHSLAFAEAESVVAIESGQSAGAHPGTMSAIDTVEAALARSFLLKRLNATPELLLQSLIFALNHMTSHMLAIFGLQGRFRLLNTAFWGLCFLASLVRSAFTGSMDDFPHASLFRYPTVSLVSYAPHILVLGGMIICSIIYGTALCLIVLAPANTQSSINTSGELQHSMSHPSFFRRLLASHQNMQANVSLSNIRITMHLDFFSALLKTGFGIITMASEAVYLNEAPVVTIKPRTWLEEERLRELGEIEFLDKFGSVGRTSNSTNGLSNGYAREKSLSRMRHRPTVPKDGSSRWMAALEFFLRINRLLLGWWASLAMRMLVRMRLDTYSFLAFLRKPETQPNQQLNRNNPGPSKPFLLNGGEFIPENDDIDIGGTMRDRGHDLEGDDLLSTRLYNWWLQGGGWGTVDTSGEYEVEVTEDDEDVTSVLSISTDHDEQDWESENEASRTPTQLLSQISGESSSFTDTLLGPADLAKLLHPSTSDERAEAHALAAHLRSDKVLTRSHYRQIAQLERLQVLRPPKLGSSSSIPTREEEESFLEKFILSIRQGDASEGSSVQPVAWEKGAPGLGENSPQCVVCQSSPRGIILWPCRCLALCDTCRINLAMRDYNKCVCCRAGVSSFSKIYCP